MNNDFLASYDTAAVMEDQPRFAGDKRLFVSFYVRADLNNFKSAEAGRPIFDDVDYIRIIVPGDKNSILDVRVTPEHSEVRFPEQFRKFKANQEQAVSGTPLEAWPQLTVSQVAELKAVNVRTVEQLAAMADSLAHQFMGIHDLRRKATTFLEAAAGESVNNKMAAELDKRDQEIAALKEQMAAFMASQKPETTKKA